MRRLMPTAKSFLIHSSQTVALLAVGAMAMAAAPSAPPAEAPQVDPATLPTAPPVTAVAEAAGPVMRQIAFDWPVRGYQVNSRFGLRKLAGEARARSHKGVDIAAPRGTGVFTAAEGRVMRTGYQAGGYGNFIEVRHPNGMTTLYGHLSRIDVHSGQAVGEGARIGLVGSTGYSTGPHLHFEVRRRGGQVNPSKVVGQAFQVAVKMPA